MLGINYKSLNDAVFREIVAAINSFANCHQFTLRESEILKLIAIDGLTNREIAEQCMITEKTVKNHIANIMRKMDIRSTRKLLSLLFHHVLSFNENQSVNNISQHAFGQIYEGKLKI